LFDFIRLLDAPSNDESNNNYRSTIETQTKQEFHIYFPKILLHIEEKIDEIYNLIIHTNSVNK
jgi:hypothetical protein